MLQGQIDFCKRYSGRLWLEVMLVEGVNDSDEELAGLGRAISRIGPERVYILTPIRPPAESWVRPPDAGVIVRAQQSLAEATAIAEMETGEFGLQEFADAEEAIMEIGTRHPLRLDQAQEIESEFSEVGVVERLLEAESMVKVDYDGTEYLLPARFLRG
jgi:wyosine [tRNA(Phe)-imidazoG37] synthetase (radical SAM superfamily)